MTVEHLLATISAPELAEWMALARIEADEQTHEHLRRAAREKLEARPRRR